MEEMKRGLKTRHISMIAIGGSIGTGLFMASGAVITQAGPGGALIAYSIIGVMLYFLMTAIGELATFIQYLGHLVHTQVDLLIHQQDLLLVGFIG